ncbi:MAG TPA: CotH kinase family protein [Myxococcaceae bacterium]|nr:CotH kinase family protein [Myxococcaceae bacterium]
MPPGSDAGSDAGDTDPPREEDDGGDGDEDPDAADDEDPGDGGDDGEAPRTFRLPPLQEDLPEFHIEVPEATLAALRRDPYLPEQPARVTVDGVSREVLFRVRGGSSRWYPKKSWRIEFLDGDAWRGRRKLQLVAEMADRTMMVEKLAFDLMLAMGAPAPRTTFVRVFLNGVDQGPYLEIERIDKRFARAHGWYDSDPVLYRCGNHDCELKLDPRGAWQGPWEKKTHETAPWDDLDSFLTLINETPDEALPDALEEVFDVPAYLRSMTLDALISNDIVMDSGSYLFRDRVTGRWRYVPWDLNNSAARWWPDYGLTARPMLDRPIPVYSLFDARIRFFYEQRGGAYPAGVYRPAFSNLTTRVFLHPELRARWLDVLERALDELFVPEVLNPRIDAMHQLLLPLVQRDPYVLLNTEGAPDPDGLLKFIAGRTYLRDYVEGRGAFLREELERLRNPFRTVVLSGFDPGEGWVEVRNDGRTPVSTAGMRLTLDLRVPWEGRPLPTQTLAPGETLRVSAASLGMRFPDRGTLGLFAGPGVEQALDALFFSPPVPGARHLRGSGGWVIDTGAARP